jgi:hypothetical protein
MLLHHSKQERSKRGTLMPPVDNAKKEPSLRSGSKVNREASNKAAEGPLQTQDAWIGSEGAAISLSFN